jgi:dTDP-4-dehydrorhamnose reductase
MVREVKPDLIVNPGAYTAVDQAESEPELAMKINGEAPGVMAEEAKRLGALLVHYSTDYVFDGRKDSPYTEDDAPNPLSVYGRTKLAGEMAVRASGARHLILRTSWVYGMRGRNFLLTILRLAREREELRIVADQFGAPTWSRMSAETTAAILARVGTGGSAATDSGIYHLTASGSTSWHGFTAAIIEGAARAWGFEPTTRRVLPIATTDYPTPAARPANSRMSCNRLGADFGVRLPDWAECLALCLGEGR